MGLNKVTLETPEVFIAIQKHGEQWKFRALGRKYRATFVEEVEFSTYRESVDYAFEKYSIVVD